MDLLLEPGSGIVDEALAILAILSRHPEGKAAIGVASAVRAGFGRGDSERLTEK